VAAPNDEDELPWQVIFIGDEKMVNDLRHGHLQHTRHQQMATGNGFDCRERPQGCEQEEPPQHEYVPIPDVSEYVEEGRFSECVDAIDNEMASSSGQGGRWRLAELHRAKCMCLRKNKDYVGAIKACMIATIDMPRYKQGIFETALTVLDAGRPAVAIAALDRLLRLDRNWPMIDYWITLAQSNAKRAQNDASKGPFHSDFSHVKERSEEQMQYDIQVTDALKGTLYQETTVSIGVDHYRVLGVSVDFSPDELKKAYKAASRTAHPDKKGGSKKKFEAVAAAYEALSDPVSRALYDEGDDLARDLDDNGKEGPSYRERVLKSYFPERFDYLPFGDPFEVKRRVQEERRMNTPPEPNAPDIPPGPYQGTCQGCSVVHGKHQEGTAWLRCTHCLTGMGAMFEESSLQMGSCKEDERITNHHGALMCEADPDAASKVHEPPPEIFHEPEGQEGGDEPQNGGEEPNGKAEL